MKKFLKLLSLTLIATVMVACNNEPEPAKNPESSSVASESVESSKPESQESSSKSESSSVKESGVTSEGNAEATADSVKFELFITGEDKPFATFHANHADGESVLDAMKSISGLTFNFNEEEGVIDVIDGKKNDYEAGHTWMYLYNGSFAELGVVSQKLKAGDKISWYYGASEDIPMNLVPADE